MKVVIDGVQYAPAPKELEGTDYEAALSVVFDSDAGDGLTVRGYLRRLLLELWDEEEGFSGKRPFGNSGWDWELYRPLVIAGFIAGEMEDPDEDGHVWHIRKLEDPQKAHAYVCDLILYALRDGN
jgi:hypothetical protein